MSLRFEIRTPIGLVVRCARAYWDLVVIQKHPDLTGLEDELGQVLATPDEVRVSRAHPAVLLFYRGLGSRWLCAVVRREDGTGFLITAYLTDALKVGETVWTRSR